ncbi:uncharacterized protein [Branchiostoma lanceolatum]|uniref:uncharacterized protein isoform X2 n=1 Tax=Branchiostoma lanceolatum TaxID=7740 RepID=UPI00345444B4
MWKEIHSASGACRAWPAAPGESVSGSKPRTPWPMSPQSGLDPVLYHCLLSPVWKKSTPRRLNCAEVLLRHPRSVSRLFSDKTSSCAVRKYIETRPFALRAMLTRTHRILVGGLNKRCLSSGTGLVSTPF